MGADPKGSGRNLQRRRLRVGSIPRFEAVAPLAAGVASTLAAPMPRKLRLICSRSEPGEGRLATGDGMQDWGDGRRSEGVRTQRATGHQARGRSPEASELKWRV